MISFLKKIHQNKVKMKQIKHFKRHSNEIGRSMVEILGVLAVIGVLSIGGIQGYKYAMDKHRANDILNEVNMRGQDVYHLYQGRRLPDEITNWNDRTATGYPIGIATAPDDNLFQIHVDNVTPAVCKLVLSGQYNSVYAMVFDGDDGVVFENDITICGENDSTEKSMLFAFDTEAPLEGGHGLCITDEDCGTGCFYCDENHLCQTTCSGSKGVCSVLKGVCVACEENAHCPENMICNDVDNVCEEVSLKQCDPGYFRSKNGACVECNYAGNIIIDPDEKFGEDEVTGKESCNACASSKQPRSIESNGDTTYCSKTCTTGISWPSTANGCIGCDKTEPFAINKNDKDSVDQCKACPDHHIWHAFVGEAICSKLFECKEGEFMGFGWGDYVPKKCLSCDINESRYLPTGNSTVVAFANDTCNNCPATAPRRVVGTNCFPTCLQPDESESIAICKANPEDPNCQRKWQDDGTNSAKCRACSVTESAKVGTDESSIYYQMCINCGRKVNDKGYCYLDKPCEYGQFRGADGACHKCDENSRVAIESEEKSLCEANCKKTEAGKFEVGGTVEGRFVDGAYCYKSCGNGYFNGQSGGCVACSNTAGWDLTFMLEDKNSAKLRQICTNCSSPNTRILSDGSHNAVTGTSTGNVFCVLKNCPNGFHTGYGRCTSCSNADSGMWATPAKESECIACGDRVMINTHCVRFRPGTSAVCNNVNNVIPDYLSDEWKNSAQTYLSSYENGIKNPNWSGKMFRDSAGNCHSCDKTSQVNVGNNDAGKAQCKHCGNRRFASGNCIYGLCSESGTFLRASDGACVACGTGGKKIEILTSTASQNLCASCTGHRAITTGNTTLDNLKAYCIEACTDFEFSDVNANCHDEGDTTEKIEIGSDEKSIADCNKMSNRTVVTDEETGKVYCQLM